VAKLYVCRIAS